MNIVPGHFSIHETRVDRICQDIRVFGGEVFVQVLGIQHLSQLAPAILTIWAEILIELIQSGKFAIRRRSLVRI
jgi:hypothetical protein